ncbi:LigA protein [Streptomyces sp. CBMAI 2042]|nr:LigA protein [Streptomyces sp. CBMAI 2042]
MLAVAACVPYAGLKLAWLAGSRAGIPDGSPLLDGGVVLAVGNAATVLMVGCVVVLALLLTRPWGLRVPAWLLVVPMWVASGLLLPILTAYPLQMAVRLLGGDGGQASGGAGDPFLEPWVFGVVYGGFIVQGLALGTLFALYARERWGHLWQGRLRDLPRTPASGVLRVAAVAAALVSLAPGLAHLLWAAGSTAGLDEGRVAGRTSDFHVLEAVSTLFVAASVAGVLLLAFRRGGRLPLRVPLVLVWAGSAQVACWGGWLSLAALVGAGDVADRPTTAMVLIYAGQMLVGILIALPVAHLLAERAAAISTPSGPLSGTRA